MNATQRFYLDANELDGAHGRTLVGMAAVAPQKPLREVAERFPFAAAVIDGGSQAIRYADEAIDVAGSDLMGHLDGTWLSQVCELTTIARSVRRHLFARVADFGAAPPVSKTSRFD